MERKCLWNRFDSRRLLFGGRPGRNRDFVFDCSSLRNGEKNSNQLAAAGAGLIQTTGGDSQLEQFNGKCLTSFYGYIIVGRKFSF